MLSLTTNILILVSIVAGSMLFMTVLNRFWPREKRQAHNDLIGWQLNIIGTTYAVILGFMLYTVWTDFGAANLNVDLEASALRNVYRLAQGLPEAQRIKLVAELSKGVAEQIDALVREIKTNHLDRPLTIWRQIEQRPIPEEVLIAALDTLFSSEGLRSC